MLNCSEDRAQFNQFLFFQITCGNIFLSALTAFAANCRVKFIVDSFVWGLGEYCSLNGCFKVTEKGHSGFVSSKNDLLDKFKTALSRLLWHFTVISWIKIRCPNIYTAKLFVREMRPQAKDFISVTNPELKKLSRKLSFIL